MKQIQDDTKCFGSSTPLSLAGLATDDDDQTDFISSLSELIQKNKTIKSLQETLMEVTDRLNSTLAIQHIEENPKQSTQVVLKSFHKDFTNLISIAESKAHISHDANLLSTMCQNIKNDLISLDTCIKEL